MCIRYIIESLVLFPTLLLSSQAILRAINFHSMSRLLLSAEILSNDSAKKPPYTN